MERNYQKFLFESKAIKVLVLALTVFIVPLKTTHSQTIEVGGFAGASYYLGDLNPQSHFAESNLALGFVLKYNFNPRWSMGLSLTTANLKADATNYNLGIPVINAENLSSNINEFALSAELNFLPYGFGTRKTYSWTPYIFGGAAVFNSSQLETLNLAAPFGVGIKIKPFKAVSMNMFWGARKTFTDELDQLSSIDYQGYNSDWYFIYGLNLTFAIQLQGSNNCRNIN